MLTTIYVGSGDLRVCHDLPGGEFSDDLVQRPCWHLLSKSGEVIAEIFDASGHFELWHEGVMWEGVDVARCVSNFTMARDIIPPDQIHRLALKGDGLEVSPVCEENGSCHVCEPNEATMWSVYVHLDGQDVQCVADWDTPEQADFHARELLASYPNLAVHGINCSNSRANAH